MFAEMVGYVRSLGYHAYSQQSVWYPRFKAVFNILHRCKLMRILVTVTNHSPFRRQVFNDFLVVAMCMYIIPNT